MHTLLFIDDDRELSQLLCEYLTTEGFAVTPCYDGGTGLACALEKPFSAIVLDVMLPVLDGFEVLKTLRSTHTTPVLILSAKNDTADRVNGLEIGADDYLPKPCDPRELVARIRAILRRANTNEAAHKQLKKIESGLLTLYVGNRRAEWAKHEVVLTGTEFSVLEILVHRAGKVISKDEMTERALNRKLTPYDRSIDVHVSNIRKKLIGAGAHKDSIINVRGAGYMLTIQNPL